MKIAHTKLTENELQKRHYAFPEKRKFPLPDRDHVLSAIKFFNYVEAKDERILANAILKRMKELGMSNVNVGPTNRFRKYYSGPELKHYGVKGMKWGVWNEETKTRYGKSPIQDGFIKEGSTFKRITSQSTHNNTDLNRPLYVSATNSDFKEYAKFSMFLPSIQRHRNEGKAVVETLMATKDIKVADSDTVQKYVLDKYGSTKIKDLYIGPSYRLSEKDLSVSDFYKSDPIYRGKEALHALVAEKVGSFETEANGRKTYTNRDEMRKHFKDSGYDAVVDLEDTTSPILDVEYPMVLLSPIDSVKFKKITKVRLDKLMNRGFNN